MSKIYIKNYDIKSIQNKYLHLQPHYNKNKITNYLYSPEGIYTITPTKIIKNIPLDKDPISISENNIHFLIDNSSFKQTEIYSQIPYEHTYQEITCLYYCIESSSCLYLVLEGYYRKDPLNKSNETNMNNFIILDFYFNTPQNIQNLDNVLIKKELNRFISILY
jgi:hypothetical protein